jgi:hypothetical protein
MSDLETFLSSNSESCKVSTGEALFGNLLRGWNNSSSGHVDAETPLKELFAFFRDYHGFLYMLYRVSKRASSNRFYRNLHSGVDSTV